MTFQFLCPQGHLLQGEEEHIGMQCQCPQCGTAFIIPAIQPGAEATVDEMISTFDVSEPEFPPPEAPAPAAALPPTTRTPPVPAEPVQEGAANLDVSELAAGELQQAAVAESMLHIPCPNGHELETPLDMVGKRARCPHCGAEFRLRREKSIEYIRQQEIIDRRRARFWFQLSIVVASFVGVVLLAILLTAIFG